MGFLVVSAVLVVTLGRLGDMYGRVKMYNLGFLVFSVFSVLLSVDPFSGGQRSHVADRDADRPGRRRRDAVRQLDRDPHRRLPRPPARHGPGHQPGRRDRGLLPRPDHRRPARRVGLACGLLGLGADRHHRHRVGIQVPRRARRATRLPHRRARQPPLRRRPDRAAGRDHLRHPALRHPQHRLDQPLGARRHHRRDRPAGPLRRRGAAGGVPDALHRPVPDPGLQHGQPRRPAGGRGTRRAAVHADHLAAGDLAAAARLRLRLDPAVGGHLHAAADRGLPGRRPGVGLALRPLRRPATSPPVG